MRPSCVCVIACHGQRLRRRKGVGSDAVGRGEHRCRAAALAQGEKVAVITPYLSQPGTQFYVEAFQARAKELGAELIVRHVEDSMKRGTVRLSHPGESRNVHQSVTLLEAIEEFKFDALIGGARRDEEKARAKERIFSHRDGFGQWQPKAQRPELWTLFNTRLQPGEHFRVFPISNWTELDVWQYIARERIALPSIYYAHERPVVDRKGLLVPVTGLTPPRDNEAVEIRSVRFRTVGDITCTCPVPSEAATPEAIVIETLAAEVSERGATRMDDKTSDASMEKRKKDGYF